jgi:hypothetical protein
VLVKCLQTVLFGLLLVVADAQGVVAQPLPTSGLTPDAIRYINGVINESVNANTLFASQDAISTGRFSQRRSGDPDKGYATFRLPGAARFGQESDTLRPFVQGNGALLRVTSGLSPGDGIGDDDFASTELFAFSAGAGFYYRVTESFTVAPSYSLTYSHIRNSYDFNNPYSQQYLAPADSEFFNWDMDLFTYAPALKTYYEKAVGAVVLNYHLGYTYLFNDTIATSSSLIDISSSTGLLTNRAQVTVPLGLAPAGAPLSIRPMFQWNNISGHAVAGLGLRDLFEMGADIIADVTSVEGLVSAITVGASYVAGRDFEGYHLGIGLKF